MHHRLQQNPKLSPLLGEFENAEPTERFHRSAAEKNLHVRQKHDDPVEGTDWILPILQRTSSNKQEGHLHREDNSAHGVDNVHGDEPLDFGSWVRVHDHCQHICNDENHNRSLEKRRIREVLRPPLSSPLRTCHPHLALPVCHSIVTAAIFVHINPSHLGYGTRVRHFVEEYLIAVLLLLPTKMVVFRPHNCKRHIEQEKRPQPD
mmetsp:Transcript_7023/g.17349  ORF Transcript_7023/g.17349 Transcript_7023/m.17349 type:complete len:205 (-) Transcript_7023:314-928(-)